MNLSKDHLFNAKILLFGEHSLMSGSMALSIPFDRFHGQLVLPDGVGQSALSYKSNEQIKKFLHHIIGIYKEDNLAFQIDFDRLINDVNSGLWFKSNIPQGYGLGSSGALVAAIFKTYGDQPNADYFSTSVKLLELKSFFAEIESYFHGKSSGLDPMISFLNKALFISGSESIETLNTSWHLNKGEGAVFLIDSGSTGDTGPLVSYYRKRYDNPDFKKIVDREYIPVVNSAIQNYISGNTPVMFEMIKRLSAFQIENLGKMIPVSMNKIWRKGLESDNYSLKLCGSGGGGMILGFTKNFTGVFEKLNRYQPILIHRL